MEAVGEGVEFRHIKSTTSNGNIDCIAFELVAILQLGTFRARVGM